MAERQPVNCDPSLPYGRPMLRGLRYPVDVLQDLLAAGVTPAEILFDNPGLTPEDLTTVRVHAARPFAPADWRPAAVWN